MIKIAQIGVGYWGPNILRNLVANNNFEVVAVCDLSAERGRFVTNLYPEIDFYSDPSDIFNNENIDAIVISTPVHTHFELAKTALNAGKHILVEKPMATNSNEIEQIISISKKKKLIAMVGHTFLFNNAVRYVKDLIDRGEIGEVRYIYSQRLNLGRIRNDIDALWNLAPHDISIVQYWLNNLYPLKINKTGMDYVQSGIDDVVFLNLEYPGKIIVNIHVSWLDPHKVRKMTIVGTKKMIVYNDISENKISIYDKGIDKMAILGKDMDFDKPFSSSFNYRSGDIIIPKIKWEEPLKMEIKHFYDCINENKACFTGPENAGEVVKILEDAN